MSNLAWLSLASIDTSSGTVTLSFLAAGMGAALLGLFLLLAVFRTSASEVVWTVTRVGLVGVVAASAWLFFGRAVEHDRTEARRALDQRIQELSARASEPGSALGCRRRAACSAASKESIGGSSGEMSGSMMPGFSRPVGSKARLMAR